MVTLPNFEPLSYQKDSVNKALDIIHEVGGCMIMDDTGLGKSVTAVTIAIQQGKKVLVVTPAKLKNNWSIYIEECKKLGLQLDWASYQKLPEVYDYDTIIVDEAHNLRNLTAKSYETLWIFIRVQESIPTVLLLSATPFQNNHEEFYNTVSLIPAKRNTFLYLFLGRYLKNIENAKKELEKLGRYEESLPKEMDKTLKRIELVRKIRTIEEKIKEHFGEFAIRTTREDIEMLYPSDMKIIGMFPNVHEKNVEVRFPCLSPENGLIRMIIDSVRELPLAIYNPQNYIENGDFSTMFGNTGIFKTFLLKRADSSLQALHQSLSNLLTKIKNVLDTSPEFIEFENLRIPVNEAFLKDSKTDFEGIEKLKALTEKAITESSFVKENALLHILKKAEGKSIIFTEYKTTLKHLESVLSKAGIKYLSIDSECSEEQLEKVASEFDANGSKQTHNFDVLLTTDILSEGVNLHQASTVIHYDSKWNPQRTKQRNGRVNRITKQPKKDIFIYTLATEEFIDEIIAFEGKIIRKKNFAEFLLDFEWRDYRKQSIKNELNLEFKQTYFVEKSEGKRLETYLFKLNSGRFMMLNTSNKPYTLSSFNGEQVVSENVPSILRKVEVGTAGICRFYDYECLFYGRNASYNYLYGICQEENHSLFREIGHNPYTKNLLDKLIHDILVNKRDINPPIHEILERFPEKQPKAQTIRKIIENFKKMDDINVVKILTEDMYERTSY